MSFMDYYQEELRKRQATGASSAGPRRKLVSSDELKLKGLLVNAFGTYATSIVDRMVKPLAAHDDGDRDGGLEKRAPSEG